jgi:hypothetical protein
LKYSSDILSDSISLPANFLYCLPAGISLPIITFSFSSFSLSILAETEPSTNTLTVSWKEAADNHESV